MAATRPTEMALPDKATVIDRVRKADYAWMFEELFCSGTFDEIDAGYEYVTDAIAAFESTEVFHTFSSKFDAYLRGEAQLSEQEALGFELFKDETKGSCIGCHAGNPDSEDPSDWLFTDFTYDNLGVPRLAEADRPDPKLDPPDRQAADSEPSREWRAIVGSQHVGQSELTKQAVEDFSARELVWMLQCFATEQVSTESVRHRERITLGSALQLEPSLEVSGPHGVGRILSR